MYEAPQLTAPPQPLVPSKYQEAIFDWIVSGEGSALVEAVAGSGKTTTVLHSLARIPEDRSVILLAFNTAIAQELRSRLWGLPAIYGRSFGNCQASTFHALGFKAVRAALDGVPIKMEDRKLYQLCRDMLPWIEERRYGAFIRKLVSLGKGYGVGSFMPDTKRNWEILIEHHDLYLEDERAKEEKAIQLAQQLLEESCRTAEQGLLDFDDQLYLVGKWNLALEPYDWVFIDEAQDTNAVRRDLAGRALAPKGRLVAVGDPKQCQPTDTLVEVADKPGRWRAANRRWVPIQTLKPGQFVASSNLRDGRSYLREVLDVAARPYSGDLIVVEPHDSTSKSRYTPEHRCLVRRQGTDYCVYLMQRGTAFRVGMSQLWAPPVGCGPFLRLVAEDADALWILSTHATRRGALLEETRISTVFGLPQTMFTSKTGSSLASFTQQELDEVWRGINNFSVANEVLAAHHRLFAYPYFTRKSAVKQISMRRPHLVAACNILEGSEVRLRAGSWSPITLRREPYTGLVYSLKVDKEEMYFADGILTHNSIYGFSGATHDAIDVLVRTFSTVQLPLTVSYRCARSIVKYAQQYVPHLEAAQDAPEGTISQGVRVQDALDRLEPTDAILCRNTAPLVDLAYQILSTGRGCAILGRDIGKGLVELVKKFKVETLAELEPKLTAYEMAEVQKFSQREQFARAESVRDRVACLRTISDHLRDEQRQEGAEAHPVDDRVPAVKSASLPPIPVQILIDKILLMFQDQSSVLTLSTIHKAKGREWQRVAILRPDLLPSPYATLPWMQTQERNLCYVAYTRAKEELIFLA